MHKLLTYSLLLIACMAQARFVPFAGAIPDGVNTAISAVRGNWVDAGVNFVAIFPGPGDALKGTKMAKEAIEQGVKHLDDVKDALKVKKGKIPGAVLDSAQKAKSALKQKNHPFREWFHREYKPDVKIGNLDRHNPDIEDPFELADAWDLWNNTHNAPSTVKPRK